MKHILIIEDDFFFAKLIGEALREGGFSFSLAKNGKEGLKKFREEKHDLILLDIVMPEMNGFEVLKKIREDTGQKLKRTPVIFLTNLGQREEIEKGLKLGANDYIIKSRFSSEEVMNRIKKILEEQQ